ncbi:FadR/GntR family transcriptional regulator [Kribbella catacumbae]|uniref:FadR/GntR family transcriptional regulator n=1 Tax=Kribbella catacumbae TaxID=460086 RepID=UPI000381A029|nr:FadR/GntR family transcriptional regulator [Kribbella catacumbae]
MRMRPGAALEERIIELIHERGLAPGAAMPTEPQLMDLLGASRNSVRESIRALQALGIVDIRHGYGTFVGQTSLTGLTTSLAFRVRSRAGHGVRAIHDLVEVRELLETGLIGEVAKARTSEGRLSALDALVTAMAHDPGADRAFHALLYENCGNELVLQLIGLFWDTYHDVEHILGEPADRTDDIIANHRRIVSAVRDRDAEAARDAMRLHFSDIRTRIARAESEAS